MGKYSYEIIKFESKLLTWIIGSNNFYSVDKVIAFKERLLKLGLDYLITADEGP